CRAGNYGPGSAAFCQRTAAIREQTDATAQSQAEQEASAPRGRAASGRAMGERESRWTCHFELDAWMVSVVSGHKYIPHSECVTERGTASFIVVKAFKGKQEW